MTLDPIERTNLALCAGTIAASSVLLTPHFAISVAAGSALAAINFRALRVSALAVFFGELDNRVVWTGLFAVRFALLAIAIGIATSVDVDPTGLSVGLSTVLLAAFIEAWRTRPPVDPNAPALDLDDEAWDRWNPWLARESETQEEEE